MRHTRKICQPSPIGVTGAANPLTGNLYRRMLSLRHRLGVRGEDMGKTHHGTGQVLQFRRARPHRLHPNGANRFDEEDRVGDLLDGSGARVGNGASRNPSQRVVVDAGAGGDDLPGSVPFMRLQRGDDLIELHDLILGVCALTVKACAPSTFRDHAHMPNSPASEGDTGDVFRANLKRLIDAGAGGSVNMWSKKHRLEQTTIQRIINGAEPKLSMIEKIAEAVGLQSWQLLVPMLQPNNPPIVIGAHGPEEVELWKRIEALRIGAATPASAPVEEVREKRAASK